MPVLKMIKFKSKQTIIEIKMRRTKIKLDKTTKACEKVARSKRVNLLDAKSTSGCSRAVSSSRPQSFVTFTLIFKCDLHIGHRWISKAVIYIGIRNQCTELLWRAMRVARIKNEILLPISCLHLKESTICR